MNSPVTLVPPEANPAAKRPLHQRIFGREEQPMNVPVPPNATDAETTAESEKPSAQAPEAETEISAEPTQETPAVPDTQEAEVTDDPHADEASEEPEATPTPVQPLENGFPTQLPEEKEEEQHEVAQ